MIHARNAVSIFIVVSALNGCLAQRPVLGGFSSIAVTDEGAIRAAAFAAETQQKVMPDSKGAAVQLEVVAVTGAERQVVAGTKYRFRLKVKVNGVEKNAEAIVWWQPWRNSEPYRLISWGWN